MLRSIKLSFYCLVFSMAQAALTQLENCPAQLEDEKMYAIHCVVDTASIHQCMYPPEEVVFMIDDNKECRTPFNSPTCTAQVENLGFNRCGCTSVNGNEKTFTFMYVARKEHQGKRLKCDVCAVKKSQIPASKCGQLYFPQESPATVGGAQRMFISVRPPGLAIPVPIERPSSSTQIDIAFRSCGKAAYYHMLIETPKSKAPGKALEMVAITLTDKTLYAKLWAHTVKNHRNKTINYAHSVFPSSCRVKSSLRVVANPESFTITLLPLTLQASITLETTVGSRFTKLFMESYPYIDWYVLVEPIPAQQSEILPIVVPDDKARKIVDPSGQAFRMEMLTPYPIHASFVQIAFDVSVLENTRPFGVELHGSKDRVVCELSCNELKLSIPFSNHELQTRLFGNCNEKRTLVIMLSTVTKRLTVTVLPLTTQGSLMMDDPERFSEKFQRMLVQPSDVERPWNASIRAASEPSIYKSVGNGGSSRLKVLSLGGSLVLVLLCTLVVG